QSIPAQEFLSKAEECSRLEANSFEEPFCAAIVFGEAARKDTRYREKALGNFTEALQRGLPLEAANLYPPQLKPLVPLVNANVIANAAHDPGFRANFAPVQEFESTPNWQVFLRQDRKEGVAVVQRK